MGRLEEEMSDIAGLRIMCQFVEDIHQVVEIIRKERHESSPRTRLHHK